MSEIETDLKSSRCELYEHISEIKNRIGIEEDDDSQDETIKNLFGRYLTVSQSICNRKDEPPEMYAILTEIIAGAFNQQGGDGFNTSTVGGQNYDQQDLYNTLFNRLKAANLRIYSTTHM